MAIRKPAPAVTPPPKSAAQCWKEFLKWGLGVPVVVVGGLGIIAAALWLTGGQELVWQATSDMATALFWIAAIALMYPAMLVIWVLDLRAGLRAAKAWAALTPEAREAAATMAIPQPRKRKGS